MSATLKNRVFYVFSSNAAPFEPDTAYAPFSVYALLEHGGDFEQAARALGQLGYGQEPQRGGHRGPDREVDISGIMAECEALSRGKKKGKADAADRDPGAIPEHLFRVPGLISRVMDFTLAHAPYPNVGLGFCGAIALQSYLCGRKVADTGGLRPNIYVLALAGSGTGKDFPRKVNTRVLHCIGKLAALGNKFASGEGIQDALARTPAMLLQNDEMDGVLRQITADREARRESIPNILMTLYTSADMTYSLRVKAGQQETTHIADRVDYSKDTATLVLQDIRMGRSMDTQTAARIDRHLVMEVLPAPVRFHWRKDTVSVAGSNYSIKRILGTVPVESDGSACLEVPAMRDIYFIALDAEGNNLNQMQSFVSLMPGENTGCVGCHEQRTRAPHKMPSLTLQALNRDPSRIRPLAQTPESGIFHFPRDIQPILSK